MTFGVASHSGKSDTCTVKEWVRSMEEGWDVPDRCTELDTIADGSVGGYRRTMEYILDTEEPAPLFEFRSLAFTPQRDVVKFVVEAEKEVIKYHKQHVGPWS